MKDNSRERAAQEKLIAIRQEKGENRLMGVRFLAALLVLAGSLPAQSNGGLAVGKFLVAARDLGDPTFAQSVVLLVRYGERGAMGVVINRRSKLPVNRLAEDLKGTEDRTDSLFLGGPVSQTGIVGLSRGGNLPGKNVFQDVYLLSERPQLEHALASHAGPDKFRIYLGYAGWAPGQLEREWENESWHVFPADAALVFDTNPESVWKRLIRKTELRFARGRVQLDEMANLSPRKPFER